jgi:hypothetical protein
MGRTDVVEYLLLKGANKNLKDKHGKTALSWGNNSFEFYFSFYFYSILLSGSIKCIHNAYRCLL